MWKVHKINPTLSNDYVYELVSKIPNIQQAMENRSLTKIIQQITGDPFIQPFIYDKIVQYPYTKNITILSQIDCKVCVYK